MSAKAKLIDNGLSRYYQHLHKPYDKILLKYCDENGLTDDEAVQDELDAEADDSYLTDFDDNFPFTYPYPQTDLKKKEFILDLVNKCAINPDIQFADSAHIAPSEKRIIVDEAKIQMETAETLLTRYCSGLFTTELQGDAADKAYKIIKAIDIKTKRPIMLFFVDSYCRVRMNKYIYKGENIDTYGLFQFFREYKKLIEALIKTSDLKVNNRLLDLDKLHKGLQSFIKRILPSMKIQGSPRIVCDDLNHFGVYLWAITNYVSFHKTQDLGQHDEKQNPQSDFVSHSIQSPVQIDFLIIPQCTKNRFVGFQAAMSTSFYESDDDEEDEGDEMNTRYMLRMGSGGQDESTKRPMHEVKDIEKYLKDCQYIKGTDYIVEEVDTMDDSFYNTRILKDKFVQMHKGIKVNRYGRLIYVIDRRNPESFASNEQYPTYSLGLNKHWKDKIYCIKPKEHNTMPKEFDYLPESLFCLSQQLLLPKNKQFGYKIFGTKEDMNGYMFTLSYHICSPKTIRAYFGFSGQIQRFCIKDCAKFWPELFVEVDDKKQKLTDAVEKFALTAKYNDDDFANFFDFFDI